jgi:hypothetical protein
MMTVVSFFVYALVAAGCGYLLGRLDGRDLERERANDARTE